MKFHPPSVWAIIVNRLFISQGVNGDINLNDGGKEAHDLLVEEDSYPRLTISMVENDQLEDSCCEVFIKSPFKIDLFSCFVLE